jgi:hypothetical protein
MAAARPTAASACRQKGSTHRDPSALHAKNDAHDALHVIEALRVQLVGHLDAVVVRSGDFEGEACGRKLKEPQREVAGVGIVIVCLDIADTSVIVPQAPCRTISARRFGVMLAARAGPPFFPIADAAGSTPRSSGVGSRSLTSPVAISTMRLAHLV